MADAMVKSAANPLIDPDKVSDEVWKRMNITKEAFVKIRDMMTEREKRTPAAGSEAPDFELERLSADGGRTGQRVRLSAHRGRPVALVFGSYT